MNGHWKDYDYGVMVELMTPNQTNDLGITFELRKSEYSSGFLFLSMRYIFIDYLMD